MTNKIEELRERYSAAKEAAFEMYLALGRAGLTELKKPNYDFIQTKYDEIDTLCGRISYLHMQLVGGVAALSMAQDLNERATA